MPGVLPPNNEFLISRIGELFNRVRAIETQQQLGWTNALGQILLTVGLVPGSDPAEFGLQFLNPQTGERIMFIGEDSEGNISLIGDTALTHPAAATAWKGELHSITLPQSLTYYLTETITPPSAQYTTAVVTLIGNGMAALSGTVSSGSLYLTPSVVNGSQNVNLGYLPQQSASAAYATASLSVTVSGVLTAVPLSGFQVSLGAEVSGGFAASSGNLALSATVVWLP